MPEYCSCESDLIDEPLLNGGFMVCSDCERPICCDAVMLGLTREPQHPAELAEDGHFGCWRHWNSVADSTVFR